MIEFSQKSKRNSVEGLGTGKPESNPPTKFGHGNIVTGACLSTEGVCVADIPLCRHPPLIDTPGPTPPWQTPPPPKKRRPLKRAVCILLECIPILQQNNSVRFL